MYDHIDVYACDYQAPHTAFLQLFTMKESIGPFDQKCFAVQISK